MMRVALGIEYDGTRYCGWQRQVDVDSVQEQVEKALSIIANHPVKIQCAGRTDTGVNGTGQVVHFDTEANRRMIEWTLGANAKLPRDIVIRWAKDVSPEFHARFSATARRYRYVIYNNTVRPAILANGLSHYHNPLDVEKMHQAGQYLVGEHDFTSFRASQCQSHSPWRDMKHVNVSRHGDFIVIDVKANAFVHHMVRNIAGSLIKVGCGDVEPEWMQWLLEQKNRRLAGMTAKAEGLYLVDVDYPEEFGIPKSALGPVFFAD